MVDMAELGKKLYKKSDKTSLAIVSIFNEDVTNFIERLNKAVNG